MAALVPLFSIVNTTPRGFAETAFQGPFVLGNIHLMQGDLEGAIEDFREGVELAPDYAALRIRLGAAMVQKGELESEALLRQGWPQQAGAAREKWFDEAERELRAALALRKHHAEESWSTAAFWLARIADSRQQTARAIELYFLSLQMDPNRTQTRLELGRLLADENRPEAAMRVLRKAVKIDPGLIPARLALAGVLEELGREREAVGELEQARALLPPGDPGARRVTQWIRRLGSR